MSGLANSISFAVLGEPHPKGRHRARVVKSKRGPAFASVYPDKKTVDYEAAVGQWARQAFGPNKPWTGPVEVTIIAKFGLPKSKPKYWKREALAGVHPCMTVKDLDNIIKAICDGMNGIVYEDDRQIIRFKHCEKKWTQTGDGKVLVKVTRLQTNGEIADDKRYCADTH